MLKIKVTNEDFGYASKLKCWLNGKKVLQFSAQPNAVVKIKNIYKGFEHITPKLNFPKKSNIIANNINNSDFCFDRL